MFIKSKANYINKVTINVGIILGCATDDEAYIELREPDTQSVLKVKEASEKGESAFMDYMKEIMPKLITSHNLYREEGKLMSNEEVADLVFSKLELSTKVVTGFTDELFRISERGAGKANKEPVL